MRVVAVFSLILSFLVACGDKKEAFSEIEILPLKTSKHEVSYLMGAEHAKQLTQDPNLEKYDKKQMLAGFDRGMANPNSKDPKTDAIFKKFLIKGGEINENFIKEGSEAIGYLLGSVFNESWTKAKSIDEFDLKYVRMGFGLALYKKDTLIQKEVGQKVLAGLMSRVNQRMNSQAIIDNKVFFDEVKAKAGVVDLGNGLYLETIQAGNGGMPTETSDVKVHYAVISTQGDTIESSLSNPEMPVFNLAGVIPGWTKGFPKMKKGGKYRLYVPQEMAYGPQGNGGIPPYSALCFYVDLKDFGPAGMVK